MQFASDSDRDFTLWPTLLAWIARSGRPQRAEWGKEGVGLTTWMPLILECGSGFWRFLLIIKEWWPRELRREEFRAVNQSTALWYPGFQKLMNSKVKDSKITSRVHIQSQVLKELWWRVIAVSSNVHLDATLVFRWTQDSIGSTMRLTRPHLLQWHTPQLDHVVSYWSFQAGFNKLWIDFQNSQLF